MINKNLLDNYKVEMKTKEINPINIYIATVCRIYKCRIYV